MSSDRFIKEYLKELDTSLKDVDPERRRDIVAEIDSHIQERLDIARERRGTPITDSEVRRLLKDFGPPEKVAQDFQRLGQDNGNVKQARIRSKKRLAIVACSIALIAVLVISVIAAFLLMKEDGGEKNTIVPGKGLKEVRIGDDMDRVLTLYGQPEERIERDNIIWLSYREKRGLDLLFSNQTLTLREIRFNEAFDGSLKEGITVGDGLEAVFSAMGGPLKRVNISREYIEFHPEGQNRVLYGQLDRLGVVEAYKYIDEKRGILFWADPSMNILQIVVFEPTETVPGFKVRTSIDADSDFLRVDVDVGTVRWSDNNVSIDGTVLVTDSITTGYGGTAIFTDPSNLWDPMVGQYYELVIVNIPSNKVIYRNIIEAH